MPHLQPFVEKNDPSAGPNFDRRAPRTRGLVSRNLLLCCFPAFYLIFGVSTTVRNRYTDCLARC